MRFSAQLHCTCQTPGQSDLSGLRWPFDGRLTTAEAELIKASWDADRWLWRRAMHVTKVRRWISRVVLYIHSRGGGGRLMAAASGTVRVGGRSRRRSGRSELSRLRRERPSGRAMRPAKYGQSWPLTSGPFTRRNAPFPTTFEESLKTMRRAIERSVIFVQPHLWRKMEPSILHINCRNRDVNYRGAGENGPRRFSCQTQKNHTVFVNRTKPCMKWYSPYFYGATSVNTSLVVLRTACYLSNIS